MTVYKMIEVVGTSGKSFEDAVTAAVARASSTIDDLRWFEVKEMRGRIDNGKVAEYQVKLDLAFHLHEGTAAKSGRAGAKRRR